MEVTEEESLMLNPKEAAALIGCTPSGVIKWVKGGELRGVKIGARWYVNREALYERLGLEGVSNKSEENIQ